MDALRIARLLCVVLASCGTVRSLHARTLKQTSACTTSTTTVDFTTQGLATDPLCLKVGDFSVLCPRTPNQPCACPTLGYVNNTSVRNNLLGCYDPSLYYCSTVSPQWPQTADTYGHTALILGSGQSNIGVCWNQSNQSLSDWGTVNNALLPSAAAVANASAEALAAAPPPAAAPAAAPALDAASFEDSNAGKVAGIIVAVVGPTFAAILWLSITFSHRQEKAMVIRGVTQHIATSDITSNSTALIGTAHSKTQRQLAKDTLRLPLDTAVDPAAGFSPAGCDSMTEQFTTTAAFGRSPNIDRTSSTGSSTGHTSHVGLLGQLQDPAETNREATAQDDPFLTEACRVAKEITARCLRRWDSFLAVRAAKDSLGNSAGVWKAKFESVRSAVLLLAFRNVNAAMQKQVLRADPGTPDPPGSLMAAWQMGNSHQRGNIVTLITKTLQEITEEEAQALRHKDAEAPGLHDKLSSVLEQCAGNMSFRRKASQCGHQFSPGSFAAAHLRPEAS